MLKTCSSCAEQKAGSDFPEKGAQCKACLAAKAAARYREQHPKSKARAKVKGNGAAPAVKPLGDGIAFLYFKDGVRLGPTHRSAAGVIQFVAFVDLSAAQLDEISTWWQHARKQAPA